LNDLKYILKLSRPRFWLYLAGPALLGMVMGADSVSQLLTVQNSLIILYFLIPANIMLYGVNDYFDREIDRNNPKKDDKEEAYRGNSFTDSIIVAATVTSIPVTVPLADQAWPFMIGFLALSVAYSAPPLRFKARPFLDSLSNGLYILPLGVAYGSITGSLPPVEAMIAGWAWSMAMHTFSAIPDIGPDRESGISTTATYLGRKKTYIYCTVLWTVAAVISGLYSIYAGALLGLYPLLCIGFYLSDLNDSEAYWYYPYINSVAGMVLTLAGLWVLVHG
jgi:4-hydroxybenzoate polyprenyltransferase